MCCVSYSLSLSETWNLSCNSSYLKSCACINVHFSLNYSKNILKVTILTGLTAIALGLWANSLLLKVSVKIYTYSALQRYIVWGVGEGFLFVAFI